MVPGDVKVRSEQTTGLGGALASPGGAKGIFHKLTEKSLLLLLLLLLLCFDLAIQFLLPVCVYVCVCTL